jgi:hypothetical protein
MLKVKGCGNRLLTHIVYWCMSKDRVLWELKLFALLLEVNWWADDRNGLWLDWYNGTTHACDQLLLWLWEMWEMKHNRNLRVETKEQQMIDVTQAESEPCWRVLLTRPDECVGSKQKWEIKVMMLKCQTQTIIWMNMKRHEADNNEYQVCRYWFWHTLRQIWNCSIDEDDTWRCECGWAGIDDGFEWLWGCCGATMWLCFKGTELQFKEVFDHFWLVIRTQQVWTTNFTS